MQPYRVGLTGSGVAERLHKPILSRYPLAIVSSVRLSDSASDPLSFVERQVLKELDLLIIGTPVNKHIIHLHHAIPYCSLILCEKPLGNSLDDLVKLRQFLIPFRKTIFVNYQLRYTTQVCRLLDAVGHTNLKSIAIDYRSNARIAATLPTWYRDPLRGGGILYSVLPHLLDLLLCCKVPISKIVQVSSESSTSFGGTNGYPMDDIKVEGLSAFGTSVNVSINTREIFDRFTVTIKSDRNETTFDLLSSETSVSTGERAYSYSLGTLSSSREGIWREGFARICYKLLEASAMNTTPNDLPTLDDALAVHQILAQILNATVAR